MLGTPSVILKNGLDAHAFVQGTLIHFYGFSDLIGLAQMQFRFSDKSHIASWNALLAGLLRRDLMHEAQHQEAFLMQHHIRAGHP